MERVLILFPGNHLGNLLIALPHIQAMLDRYPGALLVANALYRDVVLAALGQGAAVLYYPAPALAPSRPLWQRFLVWLAFVRALRAFRAERCIDLEGEQKSATLAWLSGAPRRDGPRRRRGRWFYTRQHSGALPGQHRWHGYAALSDPPVARAGQGVSLTCPAGAVPALQEHLARWGVHSGMPCVVIHPGASKLYKMWPAQRFASLCVQLRDLGLIPVLIGAGGRDRVQIERIRAHMAQPVVSLCDQISLAELMVLLSHCRGFIGNDSGPMHLAAACGAPVVALFGPTDERLWRPLSPQACVLRHRACDARCGRHACAAPDYPCLRGITPDQVLAALAGLEVIRPPVASGY